MADEEDAALQESKTDLALARTVLAVERTFNAWIKTAIAFLAGGLGLVKLLGDQLVQPHGTFILLASALLVVLAMLIAGFAVHRYQRRMHRLGRDAAGWPMYMIVLIGLGLLGVCAVSLVSLWML